MIFDNNYNPQIPSGIILLIGIFFTLSSCKKEVNITEKDIETGGYPVVVDYPAGDLIFNYFLPALGNTTNLKNKEGEEIQILTLSTRKNTGSVQNVLPIALFKYKTKQKSNKVIVAIPFREEDRIIRANTLAELSVLYGNVKRIIEEWYSGQAGVSNVETLGWENENQAIKLLLTHSNHTNQ